VISILVALLLNFDTMHFTINSQADSVFYEMVNRIEEVENFSCRLQRIQIFKDFKRVSSGQVDYVKNSGIRYRYSSPKYLICRVNTKIISVDLTSLKAVQLSADSLSTAENRSIDPIGAFLSLSKFKMVCQGSSDDLLYFRNQSSPEGSFSIIIDRKSSKISLMEHFDAAGRIDEQIRFYFQNEIIPSQIAIRSSMDGSVLVDSLVLSKIKINDSRMVDGIKIPENIKFIDSANAALPRFLQEKGASEMRRWPDSLQSR
jgi:hypothetical protein